MWVLRLDLNRGLGMWPLLRDRSRVLPVTRMGVLINPEKPPLVITNLDQAVPERKDVNPDNS